MFTKKKKTSSKNKDSDKVASKNDKVAPASFAVSAYDHVAVDKPPALNTTNNYPTFQKGKESKTENESHKTNRDKNPFIKKHDENTKPILEPSTYTDPIYVPKYNDHFATAPNDDANQERGRETNTPATVKENTTIDPVAPSSIETVSPNQNPVKDECILPSSKKEEVSTSKTTKEPTDEHKSDKTASVEESILGEPFSILSIDEVPVIENSVEQQTSNKTLDKVEKMTVDKVPVNENYVEQKTSGKAFDTQEKPTMERKESNTEEMADRTPSIRPPPEHTLASTIGQVPVFTIPGEEGYFPTGRKDEYLVRCETTRIYQFVPIGGTIDTTSGNLLAEGPLTLRDPSPGTPEEVVLIGECEGIIFYLKKDDATVKLSNDDFVLFLPDECIGINLGSKEKEEIKLHVEGLLAYRTTFSEDLKKEDEFAGASDKHFQTMVLMSQWLAEQIVKGSEYGASKIEKFGKHKRSKIKETKEVKISSTTMKTAKVTKKVAKGTNKVVTKVSDSITGVMGSAISNAVTPKSTDSKTKEKGRALLLATTKSVCEVLDGIGEGCSKLSTSMKKEGTAYVEAKYGKEAGELARNTAGATIHFTKAVLVTRRVINPKWVLKSGAKQAVKKTIKKTNEETIKSENKAQVTKS